MFVRKLWLRVTGLVSVLSRYSRWSSRARQTHGTLHAISTCWADRAFLTLNGRKKTKRRINSWVSLGPCTMTLQTTAHWTEFSRILTGTPFSPAGPGGPWGPGLPGGPTGPAVPDCPLSPGDPWKDTMSLRKQWLQQVFTDRILHSEVGWIR